MKAWRDIKQGERAKNGDRYNKGGGNYCVVGSLNRDESTFVTAGMLWPLQCMCYRPQRMEEIR